MNVLTPEKKARLQAETEENLDVERYTRLLEIVDECFATHADTDKDWLTATKDAEDVYRGEFPQSHRHYRLSDNLRYHILVRVRDHLVEEQLENTPEATIVMALYNHAHVEGNEFEFEEPVSQADADEQLESDSGAERRDRQLHVHVHLHQNRDGIFQQQQQQQQHQQQPQPAVEVPQQVLPGGVGDVNSETPARRNDLEINALPNAALDGNVSDNNAGNARPQRLDDTRAWIRDHAIPVGEIPNFASASRMNNGFFVHSKIFGFAWHIDNADNHVTVGDTAFFYRRR